jgi:hypothetical protein
MHDPLPSESGADGGEGARVLLVSLASVAAAGEGVSPPVAATETAKRMLGDWRDSVGAPEIELRRAGRRLAAVFARLGATQVSAALASPDAAEAARALVDECARLEREFNWDVPLRDVSRAIVEAAVRGVRAAAR